MMDRAVFPSLAQESFLRTITRGGRVARTTTSGTSLNHKSSIQFQICNMQSAISNWVAGEACAVPLRLCVKELMIS